MFNCSRIAAILFIAFANTAALAQSPWEGPYAGIQGGAAYGDWEFVFSGSIDGTFGNNYSGLTGGVVAGAGITVDQIYLGAEADFSVSNADGDLLAAPDQLVIGPTWFATLRARAGTEVFGNTLIYGTAGIGWTKLAGTITVDGVSASASETSAGFVWGGGIETQIKPDMSLRAEFLQIDYPSDSATDDGLTLKFFAKSNIVRAALIFGF